MYAHHKIYMYDLLWSSGLVLHRRLHNIWIINRLIATTTANEMVENPFWLCSKINLQREEKVEYFTVFREWCVAIPQ